jgi:hypothetical protein
VTSWQLFTVGPHPNLKNERGTKLPRFSNDFFSKRETYINLKGWVSTKVNNLQQVSANKYWSTGDSARLIEYMEALKFKVFY